MMLSPVPLPDYPDPSGKAIIVDIKNLSDRRTEYVDELGSHQNTWTVVYYVLWLNGDGDADQVLNLVSIPNLYDSAPGFCMPSPDGYVRYRQAVCISNTGNEQHSPEDRQMWEVRIEYTTELNPLTREWDPTERRPTYKWSSQTLNKPLLEDAILKDADDIPLRVENINGQLLYPEGQETMAVLTVSKYVDLIENTAVVQSMIFTKVNHVNDDNWMGAPPKCALCTSVDIQEVFVTYVDKATDTRVSKWFSLVEYTFKFKFVFNDGDIVGTEGGWVTKLLNAGTLVRVDNPEGAGTILVPPSGNNQSVLGEVPLSDTSYPQGPGRWLKPDVEDDKGYINWLKFNRYPTANFGSLGISYDDPNYQSPNSPPGTCPTIPQ